MDTWQDIPHGYCLCGCGEKTPLAPRTASRLGWKKGQPTRFVVGHRNRLRRVDFDASTQDISEWPGLVDRFWVKVQKAGDDECWVWLATRNHRGYGLFWAAGRYDSASRVAYKLAYGPIPAGASVCHRCDNPPCCNPAHLFIGTQAMNLADMVAKGRQARHLGRTNPMARLTDDDVRAIRSSGLPAAELAKRHGVHPRTVRDVLDRRSWKHL
jgi:hypothetical protein